MVDGFSKGRFKRVRSEAEGLSFIRKYCNAKKLPKPKWLRDSQLHYPHLPSICKHLGMASTTSNEDSGPTWEDEEESSDEFTSPPQRTTNTNAAVMGVDSSLGKDMELFGVNIKSVNVLERGLAPTGIGKLSTPLFPEQIGDTTAYPRHSHHKTSESLGEFVETVTELKNTDRMRQGGTKDSGWKHKSRNALKNVKSGEDLSAALSNLLEEQHAILETFLGDLESILLGANADESITSQVASTSISYRIGRDTIHSYVNLLTHLAGVHHTRGWEVCSAQLRHHAGKIGLIRNKYRYRIQMVCRVYTYLREGQSSNWMSLKIQNAEISTLRSQITNQVVDGGQQGYNCPHCKSALHGGGRTACPWKDKSSSDAKKGAAAFMLRMSTGNIEISPTP